MGRKANIAMKCPQCSEIGPNPRTRVKRRTLFHHCSRAPVGVDVGERDPDWEPSWADSTEIRPLSLLLLRGRP